MDVSLRLAIDLWFSLCSVWICEIIGFILPFAVNLSSPNLIYLQE